MKISGRDSFTAPVTSAVATMENNKYPTRKNTKISFRTDEVTFSKLKIISRHANTTISSLIESLLIDYVLRNDNPLPQPDDKRRHPRRKCTIPAILQMRDDAYGYYNNGTIIDMSYDSMQIIVHDSFGDKAANLEFNILFSLPTRPHPFLLACKCIRLNYMNNECVIIARFACSSDEDATTLLKYINSSDTITDRKNSPGFS